LLEFTLTLLALILLVYLGAIQGNLEREEDPRASAISLVRLAVFALYASLLLITQIANSAFFAILASLVLLLFISQQLLGKMIANSNYGEQLIGSLSYSNHFD
jgi:hypothetical protein